MTGRSIFVWVALLCMIALAACSPLLPAASSSTTPNAGLGQSVDASGIIKLNLNTASRDEFLAAIPGLGNRMVREFQEYKPYLSIQQFRQEIGKYVDDAQAAEYEKYVYVPINLNESDSETLQQIPGLDATEAQALISNRPYASTEDFFTDLSQYVSADELEIAKTYLGGD